MNNYTQRPLKIEKGARELIVLVFHEKEINESYPFFWNQDYVGFLHDEDLSYMKLPEFNLFIQNSQIQKNEFIRKSIIENYLEYEKDLKKH